MNEQIYNHITVKNKDLLLENKVNSLKISKEALSKLKDVNVLDDKIFKEWHDKETKQSLTKEEQDEINYLLEHF